MDLNLALGLQSIGVTLLLVGFLWRLERVIDKKNTALRDELKGDLKDHREEQKSDNRELRAEFKSENAAMRQESKADNAALRQESKEDNAAIRSDLRRIEDKVDDSNQRLARLEGIILAREDMVGEIVAPPQQLT